MGYAIHDPYIRRAWYRPREDTVQLRSLRLTDFKGFRDEVIDLDRPLTVLIGANGMGKSSVLEAIVAALTDLLNFSVMYEQKAYAGLLLGDDDVRAGAGQCEVRLSWEHVGREGEVIVRHGRGQSARRYTPNPEWRVDPLEGLPLPIVIYVGANRPVHRSEVIFEKGYVQGEVPALTDPLHGALSGHQNGFRWLFHWFKAREDVENERKVATGDLTLEDPQLSAVRRAIERMLPGFSGVRIQRDPLHMVVRKGETLLHVDQLSDGERGFLAIVGDLARRLALRAKEGADPLQGEAVVLVDEVEEHLHPAWQREVLKRLRVVFPNCQFIVTTHSPQVLASVHASEICLVERFTVVPVDRETWQRDTNRILEGAFGDPGRPPEVARRMNELRDAVDGGRVSEARALIREVRAMLEGDDPDVFFYENLLPPENQPEGRA